MNVRKKSIKNLLFSLFSQVVLLILGLVIPRVFVLSYGSEVNGLLTSSTQLLTYLSIFESGVGTVMCNALYAEFVKNNKEGVSTVYSTGNYYYRRVGFAYGISLIVVSFVYAFTIASSLPFWTVFFVIFLSGTGSVATFLFLASIQNVITSDGNYFFIALMNLLIKMLSYIIQIVGALLLFDIVLIKALGLIAILIQIIVFFIFFKKKYSWINPKEKVDLSRFSQRKYFMIHQIASLLFSCTDITLLTYFSGLAIVSIYTVYNNIISAITVILTAVSSSLLFVLGQAYNDNLEKYKKVHDSFKQLYLMLAFSLATTCYILFIPFMNMYMDGSDINYSDSLLALLFCLICMLNASRMTDNHLASISWHVKDTLWHVIVEAAINISVSLTLVFFIGIYGVLLGTISAIFFRCIIAPVFSERIILHRKIIYGFRFQLLDWIVFLVFFILAQFVPINPNGLLEFLIYGFVTIIIVSLAYFLLNLIFFKSNLLSSIRFLLKRRKDDETC